MREPQRLLLLEREMRIIFIELLTQRACIGFATILADNLAEASTCPLTWRAAESECTAQTLRDSPCHVEPLARVCEVATDIQRCVELD